MSYRVGIIGGTGYTGSELSRLLCRHPDIELAALTSRSNAGKDVTSVHGFLRGYTDIKFTERISDTKDLDFVMVATPYGVAMEEVPALREQGIKCIDLSGDYRLKDAALYEQWYGKEHSDPEGLEKAVFGQPELFRERIKGADLVANPGCYATSAILAIAPLMKSGLVHDDVFVDGKSGTSGAGMTPSARLHHPTCGESVIPYKIGAHRHQPEIDMAVDMFAGSHLDVAFVPHLVPIVRDHLLLLLQIEEGRVAGRRRRGLRETVRGRALRALCARAFDPRRGRFEPRPGRIQGPGEQGRLLRSPRQPRQGRLRAGGPEHEPDAGTSGGRRPRLPGTGSVIKNGRDNRRWNHHPSGIQGGRGAQRS